MTKYSYKGYEIVKLTPKDWMIYKGEELAPINGSLIKGSSGEYRRNSSTLKEAKARIDKAVA